MSDGKRLESFVAFVEAKLLPPGFTAATNERVLDDDGAQIAELDIEVRGKLGSTSIAWLIECRDRPAGGAAPASSIEQLVGRRARFGFNKITAVSTTGFSKGAIAFAREQGIELREVAALQPSHFADWLHVGAMRMIRRVANLKRASIHIHADEPDARKRAALETISGADGSGPILIPLSSGSTPRRPAEAFLQAVQAMDGAFDGVTSDQPRRVQLLATTLTLTTSSFRLPRGSPEWTASSLKAN